MTWMNNIYYQIAIITAFFTYSQSLRAKKTVHEFLGTDIGKPMNFHYYCFINVYILFWENNALTATTNCRSVAIVQIVVFITLKLSLNVLFSLCNIFKNNLLKMKTCNIHPMVVPSWGKHQQFLVNRELSQLLMAYFTVLTSCLCFCLVCYFFGLTQGRNH